MGDFDYLAVLISIVLGLGIANLLTGLAALVRQRGHMQSYWPVPIWIVTLFLIHVQTWWAMFGLREVRVWSFAAFLVVLMQPVLLFLMTALIVPDISGEGRTIDLRAGYFREQRWYFVSLFLVLCVSLAKNLVLTGHLPALPNLLGHGLFMLVALAGTIWKSNAVHKILAPVALALFTGYIDLLFTRLS